ncbi:hypothetical protein Tco_0321941 [Tanacetum coccineum]
MAQDRRSRISQLFDMELVRGHLLMAEMMTLPGDMMATHHRASDPPVLKCNAHETHLQATSKPQLTAARSMVSTARAAVQAELLALREQKRRARQSGPDARSPDHQDASGDADNHI